MKFLYIANIRFPTEKAHGLQIAKTCEALSKIGALEALWVTDRATPISESPEEYYAIRHPFPIRRFSTLDTAAWGFFGFILQTFSFAISVALSPERNNDRVLFSRDEMVLWFIHLFRDVPYVWETHTGSWNFFARRVANSADQIVVISKGLKDFYISKGVAESKIVVAPDAIDLDDFANPESQVSARERLGLPLEKKVALYIGRVDGWKGAETLCESSEFLSEDVVVVIIGGEPQQLPALREAFPKVIFLGPRPYRELRDNQIAGDVLVLPNTGKDIVSVSYTSPLKLFTYMASGVPIVASDLPSIREVLTEESAYFASPDDPKSFAEVITKALIDPAREKVAAKARMRVETCTWDARAKAISGTMQQYYERQS